MSIQLGFCPNLLYKSKQVDRLVAANNCLLLIFHLCKCRLNCTDVLYLEVYRETIQSDWTKEDDTLMDFFRVIRLRPVEVVFTALRCLM